MREYRRAAHMVYALHYHFVFITKYRKPVLRGDIGRDVRDLIREICRTHDIEIFARAHPAGSRPSVAECPAACGAEPRDAGDKGQDVPPPPAGSSKAAGGVLGPASVGAWLLRMHQRER